MPHPGKQTVLRAQCVLCAGFHNLPIPHHIDTVGVGYGGQAVCNHQHRFALGKLSKGCLHLCFIVRVGKSGGLVKQQDGQIAESGTKDELCAQNGLFARMWQDYQASVQWKVAKEG